METKTTEDMEKRDVYNRLMDIMRLTGDAIKSNRINDNIALIDLICEICTETDEIIKINFSYDLALNIDEKSMLLKESLKIEGLSKEILIPPPRS